MVMRMQPWDAHFFVPRLSIITEKGVVRSLAPLHQEQWAILEAFLAYQNVFIVKPRQIGSTTVIQALLFWWAFWAPASSPLDVLTVGHEQGSCDRVNRMLRHYAQNLPQGLRPDLPIDNGKEIQLGHNGSTFRQFMAGGRGQGRSYTYQAVSFTEMAFYPRGSASAVGESVDYDVVHSTLATVHHSPRRKVVIDSTGNGPHGVYYEYAKIARKSPEWAFLNFSWFDFNKYTLPGVVLDELTDEEEELVAKHNLTHAQLAWKRHKIEVEGFTRLRFRREYPEKWDDPFIHVDDGAWFDVELLRRLLQRVGGYDGMLGDRMRSRERVWLGWEEDREYGVGVDTSGGVGKDDAAIYVVRDDYQVVARWFDNRTSPDLQASKAVEISNRYGRAVILTEANKYGRAVIKRIGELGGRCWKDEDGKDWWTQDGRTGQSKRNLYTWLRKMVNEQVCCSIVEEEDSLINDPLLVKQMQDIREDDRGRIEAPPGEHDDLVDAYAFACRAVKRYHERQERRRARPEPKSTILRRVERIRGHRP